MSALPAIAPSPIENEQQRRAWKLLMLLHISPGTPWVADLASAPKRVLDADGELIAATDALFEDVDAANAELAAHAPTDLYWMLSETAARAAGHTTTTSRNRPHRRRELGMRLRAASAGPWRFVSSAHDVAIQAADGRSILRLVPDGLGELHAELICSAVELLPELLTASNAAHLAHRRSR